MISGKIISLGIIFAGVAIGGGWQALVAYINLGSYYIFGLPLGFLLGYKANLGVTVNHLNSICYVVFLALTAVYVFSSPTRFNANQFNDFRDFGGA